jgi:hypothetical protein
MHKILNTSISRRSLLKLGAISGAFLALPLWNSSAVAQSASNVASRAVDARPDGLVSFNAGWAIPLEDKPALLVLEEKKIKEAQAAAPVAGGANTPAANDPAKAPKKSWGDKAQDAWNKVKNFF